MDRPGSHVRCVFPDHEDKIASCRFDQVKALCFCTCWPRHGATSGDILDVVARMLGCSNIDAADHARRISGLPLRSDMREEFPAERARRLKQLEAQQRKAEADAVERQREQDEKRTRMVEWLNSALCDQ